jgi:hypothetical protein
VTGSPEVARYFELASTAHGIAETMRTCLIQGASPPSDYWEPLFESCALLIDHLIAAGDADALEVLVSDYGPGVKRAAQRRANQRRDQQDRYAEQARIHKQTVTIACPYCGVPPSAPCRTSAGYSKGINDHAARYHAARQVDSA